MNLVEIMGANIHQAHSVEQCMAVDDAGFKQKSLDAHMHYLNTAPGVYQWDWLDTAMDRCFKDKAYPPFFRLLPGLPAWLAPDDPRQKDGRLQFADASTVEPWCRFVEAIMDRYPDVMEFGVLTELNISGWWVDTIDSFIQHLLAPAANIAHNYHRADGKKRKIIAAGITAMEYDPSDKKKQKARDAFHEVLKAGVGREWKNGRATYVAGLVDNFDMHAFGKDPKKVAEQIWRWGGKPWPATVSVPGEKGFIKIFEDEFPRLWVSECGFAGSEQEQLNDWTEFIETMNMANVWPWLGRFIAHDAGIGPQSLFRDDWSLKPAGQYLSGFLQ